MPRCLYDFLNSLNDDEANQVAKWFDEGNAGEIVPFLIDRRPNLHKEWNVNQPPEVKEA